MTPTRAKATASKWLLGVGVVVTLLGGFLGRAAAQSAIAPGFYTGRHLKTAYNSVTRRSQMKWWGVNMFFKPDGRVLWVTSTLGLVDDFDFDAGLADPNNRPGTYRAAGGKLTLTFKDGATWTARLTSRSTFVIDGGAPGNFRNLRVSQPMRVPKTIDGTFYNSTFTNVSDTGSVSGAHWITFSRGGAIQFHDSTMLYDTPLSGYRTTGVEGTYSVAGYTLNVRSSGGQSARFNLWVPEGSPSQPKLLMVGGAGYLRK